MLDFNTRLNAILELLSESTNPADGHEMSAQLDEAPDDWSLRLIYADWLEDNDQPDQSKLQRLLVKHRLCPQHSGQPANVWTMFSYCTSACWIYDRGDQPFGPAPFSMMPEVIAFRVIVHYQKSLGLYGNEWGNDPMALFRIAEEIGAGMGHPLTFNIGNGIIEFEIVPHNSWTHGILAITLQAESRHLAEQLLLPIVN